MGRDHTILRRITCNMEPYIYFYWGEITVCSSTVEVCSSNSWNPHKAGDQPSIDEDPEEEGVLININSVWRGEVIQGP